MRARRLTLLPAGVITAVVASAIVFGDHPLRWDDVMSAARGAVPSPAGAPAPSSPASRPAGTPTTPGPSASTTNAVPSTRTEPTKVAVPWTAGRPQLGVQIYWTDEPDDTPATIRRLAQRDVDYVVGLGANSIAVSFPFVTPSRTASSVGAGPRTPSPERLAILVDVARAAGLRVTVRPILDEASLHPPEGWRGNITPTSVPQWFASYRTFLQPYLRSAQRHGVTTFVVGTELNSMEGLPGWRSLVAASRASFRGEISYDSNWDNFVSKRIAHPVDAIAVDAYFPVPAADDTPSPVIAEGLNRWLDKRHPGPMPDTVLSEVGIGPRAGAFSKPGDFYTKGTYDARVQPTWYQAMCDVARQRRMAGYYVWVLNFHADPSHPPATMQGHLDFAGYPGSEAALRTCFAHQWAVGGKSPQPTP